MEYKFTESNFKSEVLESDIPVLMDLYADWCGPCKMMGMELEKIDDKVNIVKVNVDKFDDLARNYGVMSIPTLILFKDGEMIRKHVGFTDSESILSCINE